MKILSSEKLSDHRYKTAEGYLICTDAIIARTGEQEYLENELDPTTDSSKIVKCIRPEEEVFSPETIASFENKPFTFEHPVEDVTPENYHELSTGFVRDVHRDGNHLVANIVVTDPKAIAAIENHEIEEVSCGYDCRIVKEGDHYVQRMIRGNHVALCRKGRAGDARIVDTAINDAHGPTSMHKLNGAKMSGSKEYNLNMILSGRGFKYRWSGDNILFECDDDTWDYIKRNFKQYLFKDSIKDAVDIESAWKKAGLEFDKTSYGYEFINRQHFDEAEVIASKIAPGAYTTNPYINIIKFKDSVKDSRKVYYIYNDDNDNWGPFNSVAEARQKIRELKKFDKEQNNPFDEVYRIEAELEDCDVNDAVTYSFNKAKEYRGFDINAMMADVKSEAMKVINGQQKSIHLVMKTSALTTSFVGDKDAYFLEIDISTEERIEEILLTVYFAHPTDIGRPNYYSSAGTYKASLKSATKALLKGDLDRFLNEVKSKILQLASKEDFTPSARLYKDSVKDSNINDAYMPLEHISKYFDAWGWPGPSQLQNVVNHYVLSKDEAEQLFKNHYSKSDYQNLKFHDSVKDAVISEADIHSGSAFKTELGHIWKILSVDSHGIARYEIQYPHGTSWDNAEHISRIKSKLIMLRATKLHDSNINDGFYSIRRKVEDYLNGYAVVLGRDWARYGIKAEVERWYGEKREAVYAKDSLILNDGLDFVVVDCGLKKRLYDSEDSLLDVLSNAWRKQNAD